MSDPRVPPSLPAAAIALLTAAATCPGVLMAQPAGPSVAVAPAEVVVTSGEHVLRLTPDIAHVTLLTETRAGTPREAQQANGQAMNAVQARLKGAGLAAEALRTRSVDLQPEYDYAGGRQILRGYVARNALEVRLEGIERVGEIIDLAVAAGASRLEDLRFDVKARRELEREALRRAVEDALDRARAMAAGAGLTLGAILRIEDEQAPRVPEPRPMLAMRMAAADAAPAPPPPTPVQPGQVEVRARVTVVVRLEGR